MSNQQTALDFLLTELDIAKLISRENLTIAAEVVRQAKEMHKQQEYETKAFWFGRGILAHTKNRINELKPIRNNEQ